MRYIPIPDQQTREEYIAKVIEIYGAHGKELTVEQATKEAERLYHLEHSEWCDAYKEQVEMKMCNEAHDK